MIDIKNLTYEIKKDKKVYTNLNLQLKKGHYHLKGKNGCGKTTLFNLLYKNISKYEGIIKINEINLKNISEKELKKSYITYVNQDYTLLENLTVKQNVEIFNNENYKKIFNKLSEFKMEKTWNIKVGKLSGGEKQKINFLIGIFTNSLIVLIDEPFNNIDKFSVVLMEEMIQNIKNKCIIVVAHNYTFAKKFQTIEVEKIQENKEKKPIREKEFNDSNNEVKRNKQQNGNLRNIKFNDKVKKIKYKYVFLNNMINYIILFMLFFFLTAILTNVYSKIEIKYPLKLENNEYILVENSNSEIPENMKEIFPINNTNSKQIFYDATYRTTNKVVDLNKLDYSLNISKELFEKNNEQSISSSSIPIVKTQIFQPKEILEIYNGPSTYNVEKILYGEIPKDYSKEIMIDENLAMQLSQELKYKSVGKLIGKNYLDYTISAIYEPRDISESIIYESFNDRTDEYKTNYKNSENFPNKSYYGKKIDLNMKDIAANSEIITGKINITEVLNDNILQITIVGVTTLIYLIIVIFLYIWENKIIRKYSLVSKHHGIYNYKMQNLKIILTILIISLIISGLFF